MQPIRSAATSSQADEWALVLTAIGIPNAVERDADRWVLLAPADDSARAHAALTAYDAERPVETRRPPAAAEPYPWMSGVALGLLLIWFFSVTGDARSRSPWFEHGAAVAGRVIGREPWRAVTALTLHVDVVHVAGNAVGLAVLLPPLVQRFGAGASLLLLLLAGALGNVVAAMTHDPRHIAVGASTAAFAAVGALVALRLLPREAPAPRKRWTAPVAGVVLLVTLGASQNADLAAHAFGFLAGVVVGGVAAVMLRRRAGVLIQWLLGVSAAALLAACWRLAWRP